MRAQDKSLFLNIDFEDFFRPLAACCSSPDGSPTMDQKAFMNAGAQELRQLILRFRSLMQVLTEGILVRGKARKLGAYNAAAEKLLGVRLRASLATTILERICKPFSFAPPTGIGTVSGSFGIMDWSPGMPADGLLIAADETPYQAKARGRNLVQIGSSGKGQAQDQGCAESKVTS
ncbi:MAG: hypothetical protein ABSH53_06865 [Holophaga sp.]|jgi:hypothetical protein